MVRSASLYGTECQPSIRRKDQPSNALYGNENAEIDPRHHQTELRNKCRGRLTLIQGWWDTIKHDLEERSILTAEDATD